MRPVKHSDAKSTSNKQRRKLMRSTWLGLSFTRFRYLTDFQENNKCNSCFVTISNDIQAKYCRLDDRLASANKLFSLIKITK